MYQARNRVPRRTFGRSSVFVVLAMVVALLLTMSLAVGAAPPGSQGFSQTWGGGGATDTFLHPTEPGVGQVPAEVWFDFNTDEFGENMWVHLEIEAHWGGYFCTYDGPVTYWEDDSELQEIGIELDFRDDEQVMGGGEPGEGGTCGDGLRYALLIVRYSGADASKWHTNSTGSQCRGNDVFNHDAVSFVFLETVDQGVMLDGDNLSSFGNYYTSDWRCHSTGTPGKP